MAAETRHAGLTAHERSTIRSTVLKARETIENDLYRQLERYGVYDDKRVDIDALGHLDAYDKQTRSQIDAALDRELEATDDDYERSVKNYVREATKTYLNRLVALKAIEVRGLVTETMIERPEYGNRSEMHRTVDEVARELTDQSDNGLGVAVELAFTELTDEIGVIFEESEHTAIDLDFTVREEIIEQLNAIDVSVWESDEAMGWVYQYFGENEREEIDDRIDEENYKVQDTDVATKTQLFTPRYIVEWMVDNSLGRLWLEMYGEETDIDDEDNCFYLAPLEESLVDRNVKDVRDIKVLDPACGSGHMLFYAFDVLYEMYLEQGDVAEKYIPREILANNLYGIDIDPGAAQLAALAIYVKAKNTEPNVEIDRINIVSADAVLVNGEKKEEVLSHTDSDLERRVLEQVWASFEHIREWGSLVRIEERIEEIIEEELEEIKSTGQTKFTDDGLAKQSSVVSYSGEEESWEQVKGELLNQVSELAEEALERNDPIEEMFAGEVEKSVKLLDVFIEEYDVIISNPPYLGSGKIDDSLKHFMRDQYDGYHRDLYASFIKRCTELCSKDGYVSMVTPENFMFLKSFRELRETILSETQIIEGAHLSRYGFDQSRDSYTIPFVLKNSDPNEFEDTRFYRMTHEQEKYSEYIDKITGLNEITEANRRGESNSDVYVINQNSLKQVENTPFVYWLGDEILTLIATEDQFEDYVFSQSGIKTGNNKMFLRKHWEVSEEKIGERYIQIIRSDNKSEYSDEITWTIDWKDDGEYLKSYCNKHGHQYFFGDEGKFGEHGIGFIDKSTHLTARDIPRDLFCSKQLYTIYPSESRNINYINGYLNSSLSRFIAGGFNPGLDFTQDDVFRLPYRKPTEEDEEISQLVQKGINITNDISSLSETAIQFSPKKFMRVLQRYDDPAGLLVEREKKQAIKQIIHGLIDHLIFDKYEISNETQEAIYEETHQNLSNYPNLEEAQIDMDLDIEPLDQIRTESISDELYSQVIDSIEDSSSNDLRSLSESVQLSPYTIAKIRYLNSLYGDDEVRTAVGQILSFYIGLVFGRWDHTEQINSPPDGILVFGDQFDNSVISRVQDCIEVTFGDVYQTEAKIKNLINKDINKWLRENFFRYHHCKEYRRRGQRIPIYWQLESNDGAFSCFVYYHSMDADTLPKLRGQYIDKKLDTLQNRLEAIESELNTIEGDRARELRSEKEEVQAEIEDISEFRDRVDALIDEGFEPDFEAGIWENIQKVDEHDLLAVPLDKL